MAKVKFGWCAVVWVICFVPINSLASSVELQALLGRTAVLMINGHSKTLQVGESYDGVTLLATDTTTATLDIDGQKQTIVLSQRVTSTYVEIESRVVNIARNARMQYMTGAKINGIDTTVLVDTGATIVAISSVQARRMNIPYGDRDPVKVETASGLADAYPVMLRSVDVGGIRVDNVRATVVSGSFPANILLGMTFLRHVKIEEYNGILSLYR